jgi:heptosyltransferase-2
VSHVDPRTILVVCPNLIGDAVMATPALRALRERYPEARIVGLTRPVVGEVLAGSPWFDERVDYDPRSRQAAVRLPAVVARLRPLRPDLAVLLPNSFRSAWVAWLAGARRRLGYARGGRGLLLTDRLTPPRDPLGRYIPTPAVEYYLALARFLDCPVRSVRTELYVTSDEHARAEAAWRSLGIDTEQPVVCLNTGGAFGPAKNWPIPHFITLARRLAQEHEVWVVVLCGPAERDHARAIARGADHPRVVSLADQPPSVGLTKAAIARSALLITTDSGPRHFAGPLGVPVVSLFGPTHIAWTRTYHPNAVHLQHRVPCGPCQRPICPEGHHRCMVDLLPETVLTAAGRLLAPGVPRPLRTDRPEVVVVRPPRHPSGQSLAAQRRDRR